MWAPLCLFFFLNLNVVYLRLLVFFKMQSTSVPSLFNALSHGVSSLLRTPTLTSLSVPLPPSSPQYRKLYLQELKTVKVRKKRIWFDGSLTIFVGATERWGGAFTCTSCTLPLRRRIFVYGGRCLFTNTKYPKNHGLKRSCWTKTMLLWHHWKFFSSSLEHLRVYKEPSFHEPFFIR